MTKDISYNRPYASYMWATCISYELLRNIDFLLIIKSLKNA